jgi:Flp pilus assembly protein TadD
MDAAEKSYRAAIAADAKLAPAYNNLAMVLVARKGGLDEALDLARRAATLGPKEAEYQDTLSAVYLARGDVDQAVEAARQATALAPKKGSLYYGLGEALAKKGSHKEAVAAYRSALAMDPSSERAADARKRIKELGDK